MLNTCIIEGIIGHDLTVKKTQSGTSVISFNMYSRRDDGKNEDKISVTAWGKTADLVGQYLGKGRLVTVVGRLQSRPWEDKDGNKRTSYEVNAERVYFGRNKPNAEEPDDGELPWEE